MQLKKLKKRLLAGMLAFAMAMTQLAPMTALADDGVAEPSSSYVDEDNGNDNDATTPTGVDGGTATPTSGTDDEDPGKQTEKLGGGTAGGASTETPAPNQSEEPVTDELVEPAEPTEPTEPVEPAEPAAPAPAPKAPLKGNEPEIMEATTVALIRTGSTNFGDMTFARGENQENTIVIKVNESTRTYGDEYVKPGVTVTLNGTEQSEADVMAALNESTLTMYASAEQNGRTFAGTYDAYLISSFSNVTINDTTYSVVTGLDQSSRIHIETKRVDVYANEGYQSFGMDQPQLTYYTDGLINGDQLAGNLHAGTDKNTPVGDYPIDKGDLNNPNYTITFHDAILHVVQNVVVLTPMVKDGDSTSSDFYREYGRTNPEFTFKATGLSAADEAAINDGSKTMAELLGAEPVVSTAADSASAPGDYTVSITVNGKNEGASANYQFVCNNATLHVTTRPVNALIGSQEKIYGAEDPTNTMFLTWGDGAAIDKSGSGLPLSEDGKELARIAIGIRRAPGEDVNTYGIQGYVSDVNTNQYYSVSFQHSTLTIKPATLNVYVADQSAIYGEARNGFLDESKGDKGVEGFKNGDTYESVFGSEKPMFTAIRKDGGTANGLDAKAPVGEYKLTAEFNPQNNYVFNYIPATLTVTARPLHIIVTPGQSKTYGDHDASFAVQYVEMGKVEGDFAGCVVTREPGENVGGYKYLMDQFMASADFSNYDVVLDAEDEFQITKKPLNVIVPDAEKIYGDENPNVLDAVSYDGFVTDAELGIADTAANSLTGTLTLTHEAVKTSPVGDYKITASGLESANYEIVYVGATEGTQGILTVKPLSIVVVGNELTRKYNVLDASKGPNFTIYDAAQTKILSVVDPEGSPLNITASCPEWSDITAAKGSYPIEITVEPNANYDVQTIPGSCVITEGDVTVIADSKTFVYGDMTTEDMIRELTVTGISALDGTKTYHDGDLITNVGHIFIGVSGTSNSNATLDVGTYDITIRIEPLSGREDSFKIDGLDSGARRLLITRRPVTFTVTPGQTKTFGDPDPEFSVGNPEFGTWTGGSNIADPRVDLGDATLSRVPGENVGRYAFTRGTLDSQPMSKNYNISLENNSFEILPRKVTGMIDDKTKTYGDAFSMNDYSIVWDGFLDMNDQEAMNNSVSFVCAGAAETANVGTYEIGATYGRNNNYEVTLQNGKMTVEPRELTMTFSDCEKEYGDADPAFEYEVEGNITNTNNDALALSTGRLSGAVTRDAGEDVGEYAIKSSLFNSNYKLTYVTSEGEELAADGMEQAVAKLTINPAVLTITVNGPYNITYGDPLPAFAVTFNGFKRGENADSALTGELKFIDAETGEEFPARPNAGSYTVRAMGLENIGAENYDIQYVDSSLTIARRPITVRPDDATKVYGDNDPDFSFTVVSGADFVEDGTDLLDLSVEREPGEDVGPYEMSVVGDDANFIITSEPNNFIITQRKLTASMAHDVSRVYGDENPALSIEDLDFEGFANNEALGINDDPSNALSDSNLSFRFVDAEGNEATPRSHVGEGTVTAFGLQNVGAENYDIEYAAGAFEITKRPITVTAKDQTGLYGNIVSLDWTDWRAIDEVRYTGIATKPAVMDWDELVGTHICSVDDHSAVGEYAIIPSFAADANGDYDITVENGTFKVTERMIAVYVTVPKGGVYGEIENPDIAVEARMLDATESDGTHGSVVSPDKLGLEMGISYAGFDETSEDVDAGAEITPDIAVDPDHEDASLFTTTGVKNAGTYTFEVTVNMDEETAKNYGSDVQVYFVDEDGEEISVVPTMTIDRATVKTSMNDMEKLYGEETKLPTLTYEGLLDGEEAHHFDVLDGEGNLVASEISVKEEVAGKLGAEGVYEDAFSFGGAEGLDFGNYHYEPCTSKLTIGRLGFEDLLDELAQAGKPGLTITAPTAASNGEETSVEDDFTETWAIGNVTITPPEGYLVSISDSLEEDNIWASSMLVTMPGKDVESNLFLMNAETGAITTMGTRMMNIDKKAPVVTNMDVAANYEDELRTDIFNYNFSNFSSAVKVFLTGADNDKREGDVEDEVLLANDLLALAGEEDAGNVARVVTAESTCENDPNSGVAGLEYYTIPESAAQYDSNGALVVDESKFQPVELTYTDPNTAYGSITVSPDFRGYVVTRTLDVSGQYSDAAVASVSVIAPRAPASNNNNKGEAPKPAPQAPVAVRQSQTGLSIMEIAPLVVVLAALVALFIFSKKKGGSNKKQ